MHIRIHTDAYMYALFLSIVRSFCHILPSRTEPIETARATRVSYPLLHYPPAGHPSSGGHCWVTRDCGSDAGWASGFEVPTHELPSLSYFLLILGSPHPKLELSRP